MKLNEISGVVVDAAFRVHSTLGPGLLESVYEVVLSHELTTRGLAVERQVAIPIRYNDPRFDEGFRADLLVDDRVLVELKSVEKLLDVHGKQVLTYLGLRGLQLGLLINFNESLIKDGIIRIVNNFQED